MTWRKCSYTWALFVSLLLLPLQFIVTLSSVASEPEKAVYQRYLDCDLEYLFNDGSNGPLHDGLRNLILGNYYEAEKQLLVVLPSVGDSLRNSLLVDLAYSCYSRQDWLKGNEYVRQSDSLSEDTPNPYEPFSVYPPRKFVMSSDSASVPFINNFFIEAKLNDKDSAELVLLDTGSPVTVISARMAKKYGLRIDSTKLRTKVTGLQTPTSVKCTLLDRVSFGTVEFQHVPVLVLDNAVFDRMGLPMDIIFGLTEMMAFDAMQLDYATSSVSFYCDKRQQVDEHPDFGVFDLKCVFSLEVADSTVTALLDTGSPFSYMLQSDVWNPDSFEVARKEEKTYGDYTFTVKYYSLPVRFRGSEPKKTEIQILSRPHLLERHHINCLVGTDLLADKIVYLDFKNRVLRVRQ